ncbi:MULTISPECIES: prephenate dehydratase [Delftia]|uniref:Bifunctional chorismate mutase/prephenate dehydratase n=1 Tax=Delftia lacustris TaxID=558537 RepID=A0A1H3KPX7_9BURK|nr:MULTISPECIES: prephenate dehydratase [Delftia]PZP64007.1 MAG: prephenate dehydratase [Delftia acidovorans]EPD35957.1 chorismate mutase [Delftia acidovorans CCUG 274B]MBS3721167.1 Bifunctional chorismate mutase/prephenate dehydratase [Delftia sp. PE138]MCX7504497.1 prephenate dehydratase [Delftia tsuruhatensis]MDH0775941.1 prephenate dehydratase [Delftia tsuruhatensis]
MSTPPQASPDLAHLRVQIDDIDQQLLDLLNRRARVAEQVGEVKKREGTPFFRPDRVAQVIQKIESANPGPLKNAHVSAIWREIMSACLALESPQRVAVLGPAGTFCEEAAIQYFGGAADLMYCNSFDEVFHATAAGSAQYGVVGVENSNEGVVTRSLDMFLHTPCHVVGEVSLLVRHNLLRSTSTTEGIKVVAAHPQALAQCQGWLSKHLPHAERRPVSSNAEGARLAALHPDIAGLASERAAQQFGLHVVAHAIQDDAYNRTRFAVICLPHTLATPAPSGQDCTSIIISVPNRPGAVHDLLVPLKRHGVSMTRFESRPARTGQWEYYFYIDLEGHPAQPNVASALQELRELCAFYKVLGTYPVSK